MPTRPRPSLRPPPSRRGGVIIIVALSLLVIMGFVALVVDIGYARLIRSQVQMNAEAAAMAAAMELNGSTEGMESALSQAIAYGAVNDVAGDALDISTGDLELGIWDGSTFTSSADAAQVNAIRVNPTAEDVATFFAKATWDEDDLSLGSRATTTREFGSAGAVECYLPLAIPSCLLEDKYDLDSIMEIDLELYPSGSDNMGWARVGASPSATWTRSQILNCEYDGEIVVGDTVELGNGTTSSTLTAIASMINSSTTTWDEDLWGTQPAREGGSTVLPGRYGNTFEAPIMVFEDDSYCDGSGGNFNESQTLVGFVWAAAYDVVPYGSGKTIKVRLDTSREHVDGTRSGGADYGITYEGPPTFVN